MNQQTASESVGLLPRFIAEARSASVRLDDVESVFTLAQRLIERWGTNWIDMREVLEAGIVCGTLPALTLSRWDAHYRGDSCGGSEQGSVHVVSLDDRRTDRIREENRALIVPGPDPPRAEAAGSELQRCKKAIVDGMRKRGRTALEIGRSLVEARKYCSEKGIPFKDFLTELKESCGLNPKTAYLYMKYVAWQLPENLGSGVMKWIVQGFEPGSALAQEVIHIASHQALTLDALEREYGDRRAQRPRRMRPPPSKDDPNPVEEEQLRRELERLCAERQRLDQKITDLQSVLRQIARPAGSC